MTVQLTEAGAEARSILRWAWQDPQQRAVGALEAVSGMAVDAGPGELPEIQDAATMLSRLVSSLDTPAASGNAIYGRNLSAQLSGPVTIGEQLELASIHGHHIPHTNYTFRHGWIPLIGNQVNDKYPGYLVEGRIARLGRRQADQEEKDIGKAAYTGLQARRHATVPSAQMRKFSHAQEAAIRRHAEKIARTQRAAERAASPATPRGPGGTPTTREEAIKDTIGKNYMIPAVRPRQSTAGNDLILPAAVHFRDAIVPRSATPAAPADTAQEAAAVFQAAAKSVPTPAHQAAVAAGQAVTTTPGTVGAKLQQEDPALLSLAAPGASMAALKAYIDARVAAEVARQTGLITQQQHDEFQGKLAAMHHQQQKLISYIRKGVQASDDQENRQDRAHLTMYTLFTVAGVGLGIAGIVTGLAPVAAAILAGLTPLVQTIHDYVRSE